MIVVDPKIPTINSKLQMDNLLIKSTKKIHLADVINISIIFMFFFTFYKQP